MSTKKQPKNGEATRWKKGQSGNPNGRPLSFRKRYKEIQEQKNGIVWVNKKDTLEEQKDGVAKVGFRLDSVDSMLAKLNALWTGSKNPKLSFEVIKFLWEQNDGKAKQTVETIEPEKEQYDYSRLTVEENKTLLSLLQKARVDG